MLKNLLFLCCALVMFSSCGDDEKECDAGFFGDDCEQLLQDEFVGTWSGEDCEGDDYTVVIQKGATPTDLIVLNDGIEIDADINSQTMFTIPTQTIIEPFFQLEITFSGEGMKLEDGTLSFSATAQSALGGGSCTAILTKQ